MAACKAASGESPDWTSALFLPQHLGGPAEIGYQHGINGLGSSMSVQDVAVTADTLTGASVSMSRDQSPIFLK